ncbi:hypothetical protein ACTXQV_57345, partial [Klebsiella pneumoniae]
WLMMSLWDALRMNMMISYQELVRTFPSSFVNFAPWAIIHSSQQITIFCAYPAIISLFLS